MRPEHRGHARPEHAVDPGEQQGIERGACSGGRSADLQPEAVASKQLPRDRVVAVEAHPHSCVEAGHEPRGVGEDSEQEHGADGQGEQEDRGQPQPADRSLPTAHAREVEGAVSGAGRVRRDRTASQPAPAIHSRQGSTVMR